MVTVRAASPDEWQVMRDIRLDALRDAPTAFASTYQREAAFTPRQWRDRISPRSVTFLAFQPALADRVGIVEPAGIAGVYAPGDDADLVSMWVRRSARGHRVGESLVTAAADWARDRDHGTLYLWVTESNAPARALYQRCGFTLTGERQPLPSSPALMEVRMGRPLSPRPPAAVPGSGPSPRPGQGARRSGARAARRW